MKKISLSILLLVGIPHWLGAFWSQKKDAPEGITFIINQKDTSLKEKADPLTLELCRGLYTRQPMILSPEVWTSYLARRFDAWQHLKNDLLVDEASLVKFKENSAGRAWVNGQKRDIPVGTSKLISLALAFEKNEWRFFDTGRKAFYLEPRSKKLSWVNSSTFQELAHPELIDSENSKQKKWYRDPAFLFSPNNKSEKNSSFFFHFTGHGSDDCAIVNTIAGVKAHLFTNMLLYLEARFPGSIVWVDSCYASPEKLAVNLCKRRLQCALITSAQNGKVCMGDKLPLIEKYRKKEEKRSVTLSQSVEQKSQTVLACQLVKEILKNNVNQAKIEKIKSSFPDVPNDLSVVLRNTDLVKNCILNNDRKKGAYYHDDKDKQ